MDLQEQLRKLETIQFLSLPRGVLPPQGVPNDEIELVSEETYRLQCDHVMYPPITEEDLASYERRLNIKLPSELVDFLFIVNGADLFRIHYSSKVLGDYWIPKYKILSASELPTVNLQLLDTFQSYIEDDDDYPNDASLDYIAFCDVGDGNYLALLTEGDNEGFIFFLDHDYAYYPYRDIEEEGAYIRLADSLNHWLDLLIQSKGRDGRRHW